MDRFKALEALKAVVDHAGFTRGAEALNMCKSGATRLIQELEDEMGVRLLLRTTRKMSLTPVGKCVYERASALLGSYQELTSICKENSADLCGQVRLEVPIAFGMQRLGPVLASFVDEHPKIGVDLRIADNGPGLLSDNADVAISVGRCIPDSLVARPLASVQMGFYASAQYIRSVGEPVHPSELVTANLMVLGDLTGNQAFNLFNETSGAYFSITRDVALSANHAETLVGAAIHGSGIALVPCSAANTAQSHGLLVPVLTSWWPKPLDVHLVYRTPRFQPVRLRKFIDHLLHTMSKLETNSKPAIVGAPSRTRTRHPEQELMVA